MNEYITMWKNYVNFRDRTTRRGYWMATLVGYIITIGVSLVSYFTKLNVINVIFSLAIILPCLGMTIRRLRDAGKNWAWIFICFVPIIGVIWLIVLLCRPSVPDDGTAVV